MVSQKPAKLSYLSWVVWVRIPVSAPYAVCPGGEGADLKSVGCKRLAGSNPVHGARGQDESPNRGYRTLVIKIRRSGVFRFAST